MITSGIFRTLNLNYNNVIKYKTCVKCLSLFKCKNQQINLITPYHFNSNRSFSDNAGDNNEKHVENTKTSSSSNENKPLSVNASKSSLPSEHKTVTELIDSQIPETDLPPVKYRPQKYDHPFQRTAKILKDDLAQAFTEKVQYILSKTKGDSGSEIDKKEEKSSILNFIPEKKEIWPSTCDILIVGGGIVGASIAYHLKERTYPSGVDIVVVEKDMTVSRIIYFLLL